MRYTRAKKSLLVCLMFKFNWVSYILTGRPHPGPGTHWTWGCAVLVYEPLFQKKNPDAPMLLSFSRPWTCSPSEQGQGPATCGMRGKAATKKGLSFLKPQSGFVDLFFFQSAF